MDFIRPSLAVVCVHVIHLLGAFFELNFSDVSSTQHYLPIGKLLWTFTYIKFAINTNVY